MIQKLNLDVLKEHGFLSTKTTQNKTETNTHTYIGEIFIMQTTKLRSHPVTFIYYPKTLVVPRSELTEVDPAALGGEILEGDVRIFIRLDYVNYNVSGGIFESTAGKARVVFPFTEHATFLRGLVRVTDVATCTEQLMTPGDSYIIHQGTTVIWETITPSAQKSFLNITTP
ncbi:MAG: cupin domain-containing protein [Pleurocapsa sp. MO_226.B13]|nr:cupin domain-containing protein [Pleurocapsa sp. MO_226.B13]